MQDYTKFFGWFCLQLVIFSNAAAMYGVQLEGLIAYRSDVKQLYFRDNVAWRVVRVSRYTVLDL